MQYIIMDKGGIATFTERTRAKLYYRALNGKIPADKIKVEVYNEDNLLDASEVEWLRN